MHITVRLSIPSLDLCAVRRLAFCYLTMDTELDAVLLQPHRIQDVPLVAASFYPRPRSRLCHRSELAWAAIIRTGSTYKRRSETKMTMHMIERIETRLRQAYAVSANAKSFVMRGFDDRSIKTLPGIVTLV